MDFNTLEKEIEQLNRINTRANYTSRDRYYSLYNSIYENLLEMEKADRISIETGSKGLGYLRELLVNDGPEFSYTVVFWEKNNAKKNTRSAYAYGDYRSVSRWRIEFQHNRGALQFYRRSSFKERD